MQQTSDPTNEYGTGFTCRGQPLRVHRNSTPFFLLLNSAALCSPSSSAPAKWEEDPSVIRPMFLLIKQINLGSLRLGMKISLSISVIL